MKSIFSKTWKASKQPRKQRKYIYNAPLHIARKFIAAMLDKPLKEKYGRRSIEVRKGDEVIVMRGKFKGKKGKILEVKNGKIGIENLQMTKTDGTKVSVLIQPSNVKVIGLTEDAKRFKRAISWFFFMYKNYEWDGTDDINVYWWSPQ